MIHQSHQREEWRTETKLGSDPTILTRICDHRVLTNWDESMPKNMKSINHENHLRITMRKSWMFQKKNEEQSFFESSSSLLKPSSTIITGCQFSSKYASPPYLSKGSRTGNPASALVLETVTCELCAAFLGTYFVSVTCHRATPVKIV